MNEFEIEFDFENENYKATVTKHEMEQIQYHVTQISPHSEEFPQVIMYIWDDSAKIYNWAIVGVANSLSNRIMKTMLNAILNKFDELTTEDGENLTTEDGEDLITE